MRVLDVGCGAGHSSDLIRRAGAQVIGIDAAEGLIDYASRTFAGIDFQVAGMEHLPFADGDFDVVFGANSVQYAADLGKALTELRRVCTPGGAVVAGLFGTPDQISYKPVLDAIGRFLPRPPPGRKPGGPYRLSAPGVLEDAFTSVGMAVSATGEVNCPFQYSDWDQYWRSTRAAGPAQLAISLAGLDAVEQAARSAIKHHVASDGSISFDSNKFIYVVGMA
ncbi:class I SAM-dependent methyltransferase [Demequina aurantiaca]|uniref:class I SAM-dependent methyltransferase n=1 Tax=Demequina aurantiaca TaxID=676200 RepID=UPI003D333A3F